VSKLMHDLTEAERQRKAEETRVATERDGEADALAWLADEMRGTAKATEVQETQRVAQEVARRRADAEAAAVEQARARLKAETTARALTLERVALERDNERLAKQRFEAEELALAESRRREQASADLRDAIAARLKSETRAKEAAEARLASERAALLAAEEKIKAENAMEATALARAAMERDTASLAEQRLKREDEAARAEAARREAEAEQAQAGARAQELTAQLGSIEDPTVPAGTAPEMPPPTIRSRFPPPYVLAGGVLAGVALGWLTAGLFDQAAVPPVAASNVQGRPPVTVLHLDKNIESFGSRAAAADAQDSSLRLVSPSATQ
jgi:hypothetical protein